MSLISVIIPVYNCGKYIRKSIDSIIHQTYSNLEILVCDDCSTDDTWSILSSYRDDRIKLFQNKKNRGVVFTRNFLLSQTKGEFILIQDGDDWSDKNRAEDLLQVFKSDKNIDVCATAHHRVDNQGLIKAEKKQGSFFLKLDDCINLPFMPATLMLRHSVYSQLGGYHDYFSESFAEDLYWVVLMVEKYKVYYLNKPLYYYRFNPYSISNTAMGKEKLVVPDLIQELISQRKRSGTDWVEQNNLEAIAKFSQRKFSDRAWLAEKYRIAAAVQRDGRKRSIALGLILKALIYNPLSIQNYVTLRYILS